MSDNTVYDDDRSAVKGANVLARSITAKRAGALKRVSDAALAQYLIDGPLAGVVQAEGDFWCYTSKRWEPIPKHELSRLIQGLDGKKYQISRTKLETLAISASRVDGVLRMLNDRLIQPEFFKSRLPGINCESGFVVFDPQGNPTLEVHAQRHRRQHVLLGNWTDATGKGQRVRDCLMRNFLGDQDAEQKLDLLAEAAGVAALGLGGNKDSQALIFVGETAGNGKSTVLDLICAGLPEDAGTALPPSKFSDDHHAVLIRGKLLNAVAELGTAGVIASDAFKKMITGDEFAARGLYKDTFTYRPQAQHIFACNAMPAFQGGIDPGVMRRLLILQFNRVIPKEERDGKIDRLPTEHADDFLAWIVDGASRYIRQGGFTVPTSSAAALKDWAEHADPVLGWIAERVSPVCPVDAKCSSSDAYTDFELYCQAELRMRDRDIPGMKAFVNRCKAALKATSNIRHGHSGSFRGFTGMWLRDRTGMMNAMSDTGEGCQRRSYD
jgi:putative DNA primase/helicase